MKTKKDYYLDVFKLLLTEPVPTNVIDGFINDEDSEGYATIADFVGMHMKPEISEWSTSLGLIEGVELMYWEAVQNGNIKELKKQNIMSYAPRIIVDYNDLYKLFKGMSDEMISNSDQALKFIHDAYLDKYAGASELKGIKIMILHPDLTFFNQEVRNCLFDLGIEYTEIN